MNKINTSVSPKGACDLMPFFKKLVFINPNFKTLFRKENRVCRMTWNLLFYRYYGFSHEGVTDKKWDDLLHAKKGMYCFDQMVELLNLDK